ncbi:hypothetical protein NUW54_g9924 [Trametes sanguinea]|uniref:Uncharacterized protein n=1 Tax=Trametes sanguinea TaxID=158606 RepID=A0ACC1P3F8_9APHY|nr:hypothetical protein NUW54_g9924 [Trametes sanguinea]
MNHVLDDLHVPFLARARCFAVLHVRSPRTWVCLHARARSLGERRSVCSRLVWVDRRLLRRGTPHTLPGLSATTIFLPSGKHFLQARVPPGRVAAAQQAYIRVRRAPPPPSLPLRGGRTLLDAYTPSPLKHTPAPATHILSPSRHVPDTAPAILGRSRPPREATNTQVLVRRRGALPSQDGNPAPWYVSREPPAAMTSGDCPPDGAFPLALSPRTQKHASCSAAAVGASASAATIVRAQRAQWQANTGLCHLLRPARTPVYARHPVTQPALSQTEHMLGLQSAPPTEWLPPFGRTPVRLLAPSLNS